MTPDEMGEKGESRFREICADAQLVCNKSDRDRTGWDFIVEFPFPAENLVSFDHRQTPISCHIQLKTVLETTKTIRLRLSSAERLAKEIKPTFLYVFNLNSKFEIAKSFLIHINGSALSRILKRLRQESAKKSRKINSKSISLSIKRFGVPLEPTGFALRSALEREVSGGMSAYAATKSRALKTLGNLSRGFTVNMSAPSLDAAIDTFLGLGRNLDMEILDKYEERFGIKISESSNAEKHKAVIEPVSADKCSIQFQQTALSPIRVFPGEIFFPALPGIPLEKMKVLVKTRVFRLTLTYGTINFHFDLRTIAPQKPSEWEIFWLFNKEVQSGGILSLIPATIYGPLKFSVPPKKLPIEPATCDANAKLCRQLAVFLRTGSAPEELEVRLQDIDEIGAFLDYFGALFAGEPVAPVKLEGPPASTIKTFKGDQLCFFEVVALGQAGIAFAAKARFEEVGDRVQSKEFELIAVRYLSQPVEQFSEFEKEVKASNSLMHSVGHRLVAVEGAMVGEFFAA